MSTKLEPIAIGLVLLAALLFIGYKAHPSGQGRREDDYYRSLLITALALRLECWRGPSRRPVETSEGATFKIVAGLLLTFATGFLLKHFEAHIQAFPETLKDSLASARFWMFLAAFLGAALTTYVYRVYYADAKYNEDVVKNTTDDLNRIIKQIPGLARMPSKPASR